MANENSPTLPSSTRSRGDDEQQQHEQKHLLFWPIKTAAIWSFNAAVRFCSEPGIILKPFLRPSHLTFITYLLLLALTLSSLAVSIVSNVNGALSNPPLPSSLESENFSWVWCELKGPVVNGLESFFRCDKSGRQAFLNQEGNDTLAERQHDMDAQLAAYEARKEEERLSAINSWHYQRELDLTREITFSAVLAIVATYYATVVIFRLAKGRMPGSASRVTFKSHFGYLAVEVLALTTVLFLILLVFFRYYTPAHILIAAASLQGLHILVSVVRLDAGVPPLGLAREKGIQLPEDEMESV